MSLRKITAFVVHCSATRPDQDIGAAEIRRWHVEKNGWDDIGYHYVIRRNGDIEHGRPVAKPGAHVAGHNATTIGICLVGGLDHDGRPSGKHYMLLQWATLCTLLDVLANVWPDAAVMGHRDFPAVAKDCPCFDVGAWWADQNGEPPA